MSIILFVDPKQKRDNEIYIFLEAIDDLRAYTCKCTYDNEEVAARAFYDLAALKYWDASTRINFSMSFNYFAT